MIKQATYYKPLSLQEAWETARQHAQDFRFIAGGTDVMVNRFQGNENSNCLIDLTAIAALQEVKIKGAYVSIGAGVGLNDLKSHALITDEFPVLIEAAAAVGSPLIRNSATIGGNVLCENRCIFYNQSEWWRDAVGFCLKCEGNICIATGSKKHCYSEFVSDTAPALIAMGAMIELMDADGIKLVKLEDIFTGDGIQPRNLQPLALIIAIQLPLKQGFRAVFQKLRQRESMDFTSLTAVVSIDVHEKIRIVLGGVDPKPVVVEGDTHADKEELIKLAIKKSRAIDNEMFSRTYRREMIGVFLRRAFTQLAI